MLVSIKRFSIFQTGKLLAVLYGLLSLIIFLPVFLILLLFNPGEAMTFLLMALVYPIMGFVCGVIGAVFYNLAAKFAGGLEVTLEAAESVSAGVEKPTDTGF